ncbi:hypothetical protein ON010_g6334 [Phytophthora cinnamomi]|nr:hypothetical protein ON010_g6334 [Phytophthora cinnamomi]
MIQAPSGEPIQLVLTPATCPDTGRETYPSGNAPERDAPTSETPAGTQLFPWRQANSSESKRSGGERSVPCWASLRREDARLA